MNNWNKKKTIIVIIGILLLSMTINLLTGTTTITINGRQVTGVGGYVTAYLALVLLAVVLIIVIPSTFIIIAVLSVVSGIIFMAFFPLLPFALILVPGIVFVAIVYLFYSLVKKKKK